MHDCHLAGRYSLSTSDNGHLGLGEKHLFFHCLFCLHYNLVSNYQIGRTSQLFILDIIDFGHCVGGF
jgi:hypothetical protein